MPDMVSQEEDASAILLARRKKKELRRVRGEMSCTECRRLKIRCDRKIPCTSCIKRGHSSICPNGTPTVTTIDPNKVLADLDKAQNRVRQLENALKTSHARLCSSPHPLLVMSSQHHAATIVPPASQPISASNDPLEIFGTLSITDGGESRFLGPSAATERFLLSGVKHIDLSDNNSDVPSLLLHLGQMWPFAPAIHDRLAFEELIESQLPSYGRASSLCEAFLQNLAWYIQPIRRSQIMEELLPAAYKRRKLVAKVGTAAKSDVRDIALLFAVFACGAAGDLTQEPGNKEGQKYKDLARSALGLSSVLTNASLASVQTMILLSLYNVYAARVDNQEESWKILSLAMSTATSLGLHYDPGRWNLPTNVQEDRRTLFWEAYALETSSAMSSGRPPVIPLKAIDVKYPQFVQLKAATGDNQDGDYRYWKYEFMRRCLSPVVERFCADGTPVKYYEVIEFDTRIREYESEMAQMGLSMNSDPLTDPHHLFKGNFAYILCESVKIRIHLNFFARAIMDFPDNPLKSPFVYSFQTTFRGSMTFLKEFEIMAETNLSLLLRIWCLWSHAFISIVAIGTVVFRCPSFGLAEVAFTALGHAIASFRKGERHPIVVRGLPILLKIQEKAQKAMSHHDGTRMSDGTLSSPDSSQVDDEDDELVILQGASRIVAQKEEVSETPTLPEPVQLFSQNGQEKYSTPNINYTDPSMAIRTPDLDVSVMQSFQNALNEWTMDMDALMAEQVVDERITLPSVRAATEDGAFASLGLESLITPAPAPAQTRTHGTPDWPINGNFGTWFSGGNVMQDNAGLFGDWNF